MDHDPDLQDPFKEGDREEGVGEANQQGHGRRLEQ